MRILVKGLVAGLMATMVVMSATSHHLRQITAMEGDIVTVSGVLHFPVFAIGAETTGCVIEVDADGKYELDFGAHRESEDTLTELDEKQVEASGQLYFRQGLETGVRRIVKVHSLRAQNP